MHPATGLPMARVVPSGGVEISGTFFPEGVSRPKPCFLSMAFHSEVQLTNDGADRGWRQLMGGAC